MTREKTGDWERGGCREQGKIAKGEPRRCDQRGNEDERSKRPEWNERGNTVEEESARGAEIERGGRESLGKVGHSVPSDCAVTGLWAPRQPDFCIWRLWAADSKREVMMAVVCK